MKKEKVIVASVGVVAISAAAIVLKEPAVMWSLVLLMFLMDHID
jgi:hypothetical protein